LSFTNQKSNLGSSITSQNGLGCKWRLIGREIEEKKLNLTKVRKIKEPSDKLRKHWARKVVFSLWRITIYFEYDYKQNFNFYKIANIQYAYFPNN